MATGNKRDGHRWICKQIKSKLKTLLDKTEERISALEKEDECEGLNYTGEDEVKCGCENTFKSGGKYGATCDECPVERKEEQCTDCIGECSGDCEKNLCSDCRKTCSGCNETFCEDCLVICCSCHEGFCDRDKDCSLISVGYGGESSCIYCLER